MAQRDPLVEYQREGYDMFMAMLDGLKEESVGLLFNAQVQAAQDPASFDIEARVAALPSWEEKSAAIDRDFGPLAPAVREHARKIHPTPEALRARLTRLRDNWDSIIADVSTTLRPSSELEAELISAQCPTRFPEIGVARERARRAVVLSRDIRARFTILHLAADLGLLEPFADLEMARAFG